MPKILDEFREFAVKGNAVDLAVGIVIGTAFNKIVNSLVSDIFMPPIGWFIGGVEFKHLKWIIEAGSGTPDADGALPGEVAIRYGMFLDTIFQFLIIAWSAFIVVRLMNRLIRDRSPAKEEAKS